MPAPKQRSIITPEHFIVAPEILGLPLAAPSRRAYAMGIDLLLIALLVKAGGVFLGLAAATLLFRAAAPDARSGFVKRSVRTGLRVGGAILLFVAIANLWGVLRDRTQRKAPDEPEMVTPAGDINLKLSAGQLAALARPIMTLRNSHDSAEIAQASTKILEAVRNSGAAEEDITELRGGLVAMLGDDADSARIGAVNAAARATIGEPAPAALPDSLLRRYMAATERADSGALRAYRDSIKQLLAGAEIAKLEQRAHRLDQRADSLDEELETARKGRGIRTILASAADDLGVGFGWSAVYFTAFLALWRGRTPGKKLAGVRVIRLDGKPLGWWMSFERFGGYAASFSVGLLGFVQILWDRNRQGLHDKACETVVVSGR